MYRTTAIRLRRVALVSALTIGASGGALAGTTSIINTGTNAPLSASANTHGLTSTSKAAHPVASAAVPTAVHQATATVAVTSPSGTVSKGATDS
jgi:hypothetical protein